MIMAKSSRPFAPPPLPPKPSTSSGSHLIAQHSERSASCPLTDMPRLYPSSYRDPESTSHQPIPPPLPHAVKGSSCKSCHPELHGDTPRQSGQPRATSKSTDQSVSCGVLSRCSQGKCCDVVGCSTQSPQTSRSGAAKVDKGTQAGSNFIRPTTLSYLYSDNQPPTPPPHQNICQSPPLSQHPAPFCCPAAASAYHHYHHHTCPNQPPSGPLVHSKCGHHSSTSTTHHHQCTCPPGTQHYFPESLVHQYRSTGQSVTSPTYHNYFTPADTSVRSQISEHVSFHSSSALPSCCRQALHAGHQVPFSPTAPCCKCPGGTNFLLGNEESPPSTPPRISSIRSGGIVPGNLPSKHASNPQIPSSDSSLSQPSSSFRSFQTYTAPSTNPISRKRAKTPPARISELEHHTGKRTLDGSYDFTKHKHRHQPDIVTSHHQSQEDVLDASQETKLKCKEASGGTIRERLTKKFSRFLQHSSSSQTNDSSSGAMASNGSRGRSVRRGATLSHSRTEQKDSSLETALPPSTTPLVDRRSRSLGRLRQRFNLFSLSSSTSPAPAPHIAPPPPPPKQHKAPKPCELCSRVQHRQHQDHQGASGSSTGSLSTASSLGGSQWTPLEDGLVPPSSRSKSQTRHRKRHPVHPSPLTPASGCRRTPSQTSASSSSTGPSLHPILTGSRTNSDSSMASCASSNPHPTMTLHQTLVGHTLGSSASSVTSSNAASENATTSSANTAAAFAESMQRIKRMGVYWGPLSTTETEKLMANKPDGTFLVRDSAHDSYILSVSFRANQRTYHARAEHVGGKSSLLSGTEPQGASSVEAYIVAALEQSMRSTLHLVVEAPEAGDPLQAPPGPPPPTVSLPVALLYPLSRNLAVHSLMHLCRFEILTRVRRDHVDKLPLPNRMKQYLKMKQYYAECIEDFTT